MKKTIILALLCSCIACKKKEITSLEAVGKINNIVKGREMTKARFDKELLPLVNDLYGRDSIRYKYIHIIALKALKAENEQNDHVFKMQIAHLQDQLKFVE